MKTFRIAARRLAVIVLAALFSMHSAGIACPSCYGEAESPMTAGMNTAILVMLGIIGFVLSFIAAAFFLLWKRGRQNSLGLSDKIFVDEHGSLKSKNEKGVVEWNNF